MVVKKDEDSKQKILNAAIKLFAHKSFEAVSTREICREAGVNLCLISYYFGGKQELYNAIIEDLIEKQCRYAETFMDINLDPQQLSKQEQIDLLLKILDKFIDYFYSNISTDLILLLLKEQQARKGKFDTPVFSCFRKVVAAVFNMQENSREAIYQTLFIIAQLNSPRVLPGFSLRLLGQDTFFQEDIKIIRENVKLYVKLMLKEHGIV